MRITRMNTSMPCRRHATAQRLWVYAWMALLIGYAVSAAAVTLPDDIAEKLNANHDLFVKAAGFERPIDHAPHTDFNSRQRFPNPNTTSALSADAALEPATKALMLLDNAEPALPRVRYRITQRANVIPEATGYPVHYIEVIRFNLGPALYQEIVASTPEGVPVRKAEFGSGPSVSWRFVMRRRQGALLIERAARRELTTEQAATMDCLGMSCLSTTDPHGPEGDWQNTTPPRVASTPYITLANGRSTAPRIASLLVQKAGIEPLPIYGEQPQLTLIISMNVEGNEFLANGLMHQSLMRDDAIAGIWTRRRDYGQEDVGWQELLEYRPGRAP